MKTRIFLSLFCLVAFVFQAYGADPDLVVYMPMDELNGDQFADTSGNGFDGTLVGDAALVDGKHGKALEFTADAEIQIPDDESMDGIQAITLAVWVWQEDHQATGIIQKGGGWGNMSYLIQPWSDQQIYFGILDTSSRAITQPGDYPMGEWYHMAGTFDGESLTIYINGEEKAQAPAPTDTIPDTAEPLQVGNRLAGVLDDFVMYSRALTADEIKAIMEGNILPVEIGGKLASTWASVKSVR
jgi:hypothetical protein